MFFIVRNVNFFLSVRKLRGLVPRCLAFCANHRPQRVDLTYWAILAGSAKLAQMYALRGICES